MQWKSVQLETSCSTEANRQTYTTTQLDPYFFFDRPKRCFWPLKIFMLFIFISRRTPIISPSHF